MVTALLFVLWKSPYSQGFIDLFSSQLYTISRVVDFSDLLALVVLPIAYYNKTRVVLKLNPYLLSVISLFAFCATSLPEPTQRFYPTQYLLYSSQKLPLDTEHCCKEIIMYEIDSLFVVGVDQITVEGNELEDIYKLKYLRNLERRVLVNTAKNKDEQLFDSIFYSGTKSISLSTEKHREELNFENSRLHGKYERYALNGQLLISGRYSNGLKDSIWKFYDQHVSLYAVEHLVNGELFKIERYKDADLERTYEYRLRDELIHNKCFQLFLLLLFMIDVVMSLIISFRQNEPRSHKQSQLLKLFQSLYLPFVVFVIARIISALLPATSPLDIFFFLGELVLLYLVLFPIFMILFYWKMIKTSRDINLYVFLFALALVLVEEGIYLNSIWY